MSDYEVQRPLHMRNNVVYDEVARVGEKGYSDLATAIREGQGDYIDVLRNCVVTEPVDIFTAGTTLDLGGNTVVFLPPDQDEPAHDDPPAISISAPGVTFYNGRIAVLSGADYAIRIRQFDHKAELALLDVGIAYEGAGCAIAILEGIVFLRESRIESYGSGIELASRSSHMGIVQSRVIATQRAATVCGGRFILDESKLASIDSEGIFATDGLVGIHNSTVGSYGSSAIRVQAEPASDMSPSLRICEHSELTSVKGEALVLSGGNAAILRSMIRSFGDAAIEMDALDDTVPTQLAVGGLSTVSSWRGDGIVHKSGELRISRACIDARNDAIREDMPV